MCAHNDSTVTLAFTLVKDAPTFVTGLMAGNDQERSFEKGKQPIEISKDGKTFTVIVERKLWERRLARNPGNPVVEAVKKVADRIKRKCLMCTHEFMALPQMRICGHCKKTSAWKSGGDYSVA